MIMSILLLGCVDAVYAADTKGQSSIIAEAEMVKSKKIVVKPEVSFVGGNSKEVEESKDQVEVAEPQVSPIEGTSSVEGVTAVPMSTPRNKSWKKGVAAFGNYDYEQAIFYFTDSPSPLAKYYLAKIYFGDVPINNLDNTSLPEINRQKAIDILNTIINYKESQELKNKYTVLMNSPEALSKFYYERGNYEETEKAIELVQSKETKEMIRQKYQSYSQSPKNSTSTANSKESVVPKQPELKLSTEEAAFYNTIESKREPTFVEEENNGHDSFSEAISFIDGYAVNEEEGEIRIDSKPSSARKQYSEPDNEPDTELVKGSMVVSIKPTIVWDWPALPGYDYKPVTRIEENTKMVLLDDIGNKWYYKVELPDSRVGYICSYLVEGVDKKAKESVQKTEIIEECSEYINYLVDRHEEKKQIVEPVKKKKNQAVKKSIAKKQPAKSAKTQSVKPQGQPEVVFVDELPVQSQPSTASKKPISEVSKHKPAPAGEHH